MPQHARGCTRAENQASSMSNPCRYESEHLNSLGHCLHVWMNQEQLAQVGSYHVEEHTQVCYFCGLHEDRQAVEQPKDSTALADTDVSAVENVPRYANYACEWTRLRSFMHWPDKLRQTPQQLAKAGFFYEGFEDRVYCFSCGLGFEKWQQTDEPWEQHALHSSQCRFLKYNKELKLAELMPRVSSEERLCKICFMYEYNTALMNCGHVVACARCAVQLSECPLCRKSIVDIKRVYFS